MTGKVSEKGCLRREVVLGKGFVYMKIYDRKGFRKKGVSEER